MSTLYSVLQSFFGTYAPITVDYTYQNTQGYVQHSITVVPDWGYIATLVVFSIVLLSVFKFIGGLFSK